jgi:hypothetical protein
MKITRKQALPILSATFPEYKGRKININITDNATLWNLNWCEGTRNYYVAVRWDGAAVPVDVPAPWLHHMDGQRVNIPQGHALVCRSFVGMSEWITIYANIETNLLAA